jgi:hypothetical protein
MRYKCCRSNTDKALHLVCYDARFDELPPRIKQLGPWIGSKEEAVVERLKPQFRAQQR